MTELMIARESGENIAELIEAHSQSSMMVSIAHTIRTIVEEAGENGWILINSKKRVSYPCACGCGKMVRENPIGRPREYYSDACRTRVKRRRDLWSSEEEGVLIKTIEEKGDDIHVLVAFSLRYKGRSVKAIRSKCAELRRKGRLE